MSTKDNQQIDTQMDRVTNKQKNYRASPTFSGGSQIRCLGQGDNAVTPVGLELANLQAEV